MTTDTLTAEERILVQDVLMRRYLRATVRQEGRRRGDLPVNPVLVGRLTEWQTTRYCAWQTRKVYGK